MYRAILIDPQAKEISEVEYDGTIDHIYQLIACSTFAVPVTFSNLDALYCDDEALLSREEEKLHGFMLRGWEYPIYGKALIIGSTPEGEDRNAGSSVAGLREQIEYHQRDGSERLPEWTFVPWD